MLEFYTQDYINVVLYITVAFLLILLLFIISAFFNARELGVFNTEKLSIYECGFDPFGKVRKKFDIKYYIVAILFIVFDLEIVLLLPWLFIYNRGDIYMFWVVWFFIIVLIIGFLYEWVNGALEWQ